MLPVPVEIDDVQPHQPVTKMIADEVIVDSLPPDITISCAGLCSNSDCQGITTDSRRNYFCYICFEDKNISDGESQVDQDEKENDGDQRGKDQSFLLPCKHRFCRDCMYNFLKSTISEGQVNPKCFYPIPQVETVETADGGGASKASMNCGLALPNHTIVNLISRDKDLTTKYNRFSFLINDINGRECPYPGCGHLQSGDPDNPNMICAK